MFNVQIIYITNIFLEYILTYYIILYVIFHSVKHFLLYYVDLLQNIRIMLLKHFYYFIANFHKIKNTVVRELPNYGIFRTEVNQSGI